MAAAYQDPAQVLERNRRNAATLSQKVGVERVRKLLERAQTDLNKRLANADQLRTGADEPFTTVQMRATLAQVRHVLGPLQTGMHGQILDQGKAAAGQETEDILAYLNAAEAKYKGVAMQTLAIDEAMLHDRVASGVNASLLQRIQSDPTHKGHKGVLERYGDNVIENFEEQLQLRVLARKPWGDVRAALIKESPFLQWAPSYWAERILRTETMFAHNRAGLDAIQGADQELGDMVKILSATFDGRTGSDSYAVHGQIRRPDEAFESWFGAYQHPPNRPNDREIVVAHRISWPLPPYLAAKSDGAVLSAWSREGRKGSPPGRPLMTTVPLDQFGKVQPPPVAPEVDAPDVAPLYDQPPPNGWPPAVLPADLGEQVRPMPIGEDFETPGELEGFAQLKGAMDNVDQMPEVEPGWIDAPWQGQPYDVDADEPIEVELPKKIHAATLKVAEKKGIQQIDINKIASQYGPTPTVEKAKVHAELDKQLVGEKPPPVMLFKKGDWYWFHDEPHAGPVTAAAYHKGGKTVDALVVDLAAVEAKKAQNQAWKQKQKQKVAQTMALPEQPAPKLTSEVVLAKKISGKKGSNEGGLYLGKDGKERYVKFYKDPSQASCEHLANAIYRDLGIGGPKSNLFEHEGKLAYSSEILEGQTLADAGMKKEHAVEFMKGFAADVLTGNWDAVGMSHDNAFVTKDGRVIRIDSGGTFLYRAKAGKKEKHYLKEISEWDGFFSDSLNRAYKGVAELAGIEEPGDMGKALVEQIEKIKALRKQHGGWKAYVDKLVGAEMDAADKAEVIAMLEKRTDLLDEKIATLKPKAPLEPIKATPEPLRPGATLAVYDKASPLAEKIRDHVKSVEYDSSSRETFYKQVYSKAKLSTGVLAQAHALIDRWTGEYKDSPGHMQIYKAVEALKAKKGPTSSKYDSEVRDAASTRKARWKAALEAVGEKKAKAPDHLDIYRGMKGKETAVAIAKAWMDETATHVKIESYAVASWSFDKNVADKFSGAHGGGTGATCRWMHCPLEDTYWDQFVDDGDFVTTFGPSKAHEAEVVAGPGHDEGLELPKHDQIVHYKGKSYGYEQRDELVKAMRKNKDL